MRPDAASVQRGQTLVDLRHVYKIYRVADTGVAALGGVNFDIVRGEFVAIVGPSGSGKSSILNLIGGLDRASAGEVVVAGGDLGRLSEDELTLYRRDQIGFVWQGTARNLVPYLTLADNVGLPLMASELAPAARRARIDRLLELVGLRDRATHLPAMLSGGEQQRGAVAVALANLPALLLADEPTAELDTAAADRVLSAFRAASDEFDSTVVMVTHDLLAAARADRTLRLLDGRIRHSPLPGRVDDEGSLMLPDEVVAALTGTDLEVEMEDGEVRIRRRREQRYG
ncbi:MAG TPA: ABC transporter ATP-binding protein [Actinomycetota bacterium]